MSGSTGIGLPEALERAAEALPAQADSIRPANGDPARLLELLDAEAASQVLAWLLAHELADAEELAEAWAEDAERGAPALLSVAEDALSKPARKLLRRVRHRLRSSGVEVPVAPPAQVVATLPPVEEALEEALVFPLDPRGARAAFLVSSNPAGGVRMFELLLDEVEGILEVRVYNASRGRVKRFVRSFVQRSDFPAVSAPPDAVRALVRRIAEAHPSNRPLPRAFSEWRAQLAAAAEGTPTPGDLVRAELGEVEAEPELLQRVAEKVKARELGPWPPAAEALHPVADQLGEAAKGQVIVAEARRREQVDRVLDEALAGLFAEPFAGRTAARFEEMAYWFWQRSRGTEADAGRAAQGAGGETGSADDDDARACLAAARAFRDTSPAENPVARAMIDVVLAPVLAKLDEEIHGDEEKSHLVQGGEGET